jgi:hypothetical protein
MKKLGVPGTSLALIENDKMAPRTVCEGRVQAEHRRAAPSSDGVFDLVQDGIEVAILPGEACDGMPPDLQCCPISNL